MNKAERQAHKAKMDAIHSENNRIVATGVCPTCGSALKRNLSLTGWWQCEQFGDGQFRKRPLESSCNFQCFTA